MNWLCWQLWRIVAAGLLIAGSCKPKEDPAPVSPGTAASPESVAMMAAMTRGMKQILLTNLSRSHMSATCVLVTRAPRRGDSHRPAAPADRHGLHHGGNHNTDSLRSHLLEEIYSVHPHELPSPADG